MDKTHLDQLLRQAVDDGDVPGVAVSLGNRGGTLYEAGFGKRSLDGAQAMTADTVCWIASMTKAITAAAAMQLCERGKLSLDAPIREILPELARPQVLEGFDTDGKPRLRDARRPITLRHLLTHTSGFTYDMWSADMKRYQKSVGIPAVITCQNNALNTPLLFDPGERWEYGIGIDWVGKAIEAASGSRLGAYFADHIFEPLGMTDTRFKLGRSQSARRAAIHVRGSDGLQPTAIVLEQNPEFEMGGGGLYGTVGDYLTFARMILNGGTLAGRRILKEETVALMTKNAMGPIRCGVMTTVDPKSTHTVEFTKGMEWGLSFMINPEPLATGRSTGSLAWAGLANSYYWIDVEKGLAGVFATQILPFADPEALRLFQAFETAAYKSA